MIDIEVHGVDELVAKMGNRRLIGKPLRNLLTSINNHLKKEVESRMPVNTGRLKSSITEELSKAPVPLWSKVSTKVFYSRFLEKGTQKMAPRRMFEKALEASKDKIQELVRTMEREIEGFFNR